MTPADLMLSHPVLQTPDDGHTEGLAADVGTAE